MLLFINICLTHVPFITEISKQRKEKQTLATNLRLTGITFWFCMIGIRNQIRTEAKISSNVPQLSVDSKSADNSARSILISPVNLKMSVISVAVNFWSYPTIWLEAAHSYVCSLVSCAYSCSISFNLCRL